MRGRVVSGAPRILRRILLAVPLAAGLALAPALAASADAIRSAEYWLAEYGIRDA